MKVKSLADVVLVAAIAISMLKCIADSAYIGDALLALAYLVGLLVLLAGFFIATYGKSELAVKLAGLDELWLFVVMSVIVPSNTAFWIILILLNLTLFTMPKILTNKFK